MTAALQQSWESKLPETWSMKPLKQLAAIANSNVDKKSYDGEQAALLCNYTNVYYNEYIRAGLDFMSATASSSARRRFELQAGDVIITKDSESWDDIAVPACVVEDLPGVVCGYHLTLLRPHASSMSGPFLFRCLQSTGVREQFWVAATGVTRFGLGQKGIREARFPVPPLPAQRAIATFLDRKTAAIDALIEKKERLLELLAEKRAALIHRAVTKGLDPDVPMKDSGVPWIGEIPAHWEVFAIKRFARRGYKTFTDGDWIEAPYITDDGVRLLQTGNIGRGEFKEKGFRYVSAETFLKLRCTEVLPGDVLICRLDGPVGRGCLAPDLGVRMITSVDNAILKVADRHDPRYLVYALNLPGQLEWIASLTQVGGGHRWRISRSMLGDLKIAAPNPSEQRLIADTLDEFCGAVRKVEARTGRQLKRLREYRQALITAAVTGQLEIPEEAA